MAAATLQTDVLIVGAGSAGSVVAEQLSRDSDCRLTVLEAGAGPADPVASALAADGRRLPIGTASPIVWRYQTELTADAAGAMAIVRGATVGGSGAVNGGYFCWGVPQDFDRTGLPGWAWADVVGHYRAIETDLDFGGPDHGDRGPIPVRRTRDVAESAQRFVAAARDAGFGWLPDLNAVGEGGGPCGVGAVPLNIVDGVRTGPGAACLVPGLARENLALLARTRAVRVDICAGRAVGVRAVGPDGPITVQADRVVLCAGAIETAHLLMLSGIGDPEMLRAVGVEPVSAVPVGAGCSDHPEWVLPVDWPVAAGRPPLEVVLHTDDAIEIRPYTGGFTAMVGDAASGRPDRPHIGAALMRPRSRGRLTLVSADPRVPPRIEHRYDSEPADLAALARGVQLVRRMIAGSAELGRPTWSTSQHLCGSAPMGADDDPRAVLDPRCRVRGVDGLWVADGSALPAVPSRGPHASIVMLGHRAAEFVRAGA